MSQQTDHQAPVRAIADEQLRAHGYTGTFTACTCEVCDLARGFLEQAEHLRAAATRIEQLEQENAALRENEKALDDERAAWLNKAHEECRRAERAEQAEQARDALAAERDRLKTALLARGHYQHCDIWLDGGKCTCGLASALHGDATP